MRYSIALVLSVVACGCQYEPARGDAAPPTEAQAETEVLWLHYKLNHRGPPPLMRDYEQAHRPVLPRVIANYLLWRADSEQTARARRLDGFARR